MIHSSEIRADVSLIKSFQRFYPNQFFGPSICKSYKTAFFTWDTSSYRQVSCLASASIQPIESNLLPRFLICVFGMTSTEKNAKEKF